MNSFKDLQNGPKNLKTFDNYMKASKSKSVIQSYNNDYDKQQYSLDPQIIGKDYAGEDDDINTSMIDYSSAKDTQQRTVIQTDKVNVMAQPENIMMMLTADSTNPMLHDGELRRQQRSGQIMLADNNTVAPQGVDQHTQFQERVVKINQGEVGVKQKLMFEQRVQEPTRPLDKEYSRNIDPDGYLHRQAINKNLKFQNDLREFVSKQGDLNKKEIKVPLIGLQHQQDMNKTIAPGPRDNIITKQANKFREMLSTQTPKITQNVIRDFNISELINMPTTLQHFVNTNINQQNIYDIRTQSSANQTRFMSFQQKFLNAANKFIPVSDRVIERPKNYYSIVQDNRKKYTPQSTNNIGGQALQQTNALNLPYIGNNNSSLKQMLMSDRKSELYGNTQEDVFNQYGEMNLGRVKMGDIMLMK